MRGSCVVSRVDLVGLSRRKHFRHLCSLLLHDVVHSYFTAVKRLHLVKMHTVPFIHRRNRDLLFRCSALRLRDYFRMVALALIASRRCGHNLVHPDPLHWWRSRQEFLPLHGLELLPPLWCEYVLEASNWRVDCLHLVLR